MAGIVWNYIRGAPLLDPTATTALSAFFEALHAPSASQATETSFTLHQGDSAIVFSGSFTKNIWGVITGGTITGFKAYGTEGLVLDGSGYSFSYQDFWATKAQLGSNPEPFLNLLFGASMTHNGSDDNDFMLGLGLSNIVYAHGGDDRAELGSGNDFFSGGAGKDVAEGGTGVDTIDYSEKSDSVAVVLSPTGQVEVLVGGIVEDKIYEFENVLGSKGNDEITGDGLVNMLVGNAGDDRLFGMDGNDLLSGATGRDRIDGGKGNDQVVGGDGSDILRGGEDSDTFLFNTALGPNNVDKLKDFSHIADTISLIDDVFVGLAPGVLAKKFFHVGEKAHDGNDHIIYDRETGKLFYDADGKGGAKQALFAKVEDGLKVTADDFLIG